MPTQAKQKNKLTKKEQSTTTAYKMMSEKINKLEASLKKTQDESGKIHSEKYEIEKKNILLWEKLKDRFLIRVLEFISAGGFGFAISYLSEKNYQLVLFVGIPSFIIYIVCLYLTRK
jgi:hypothetical protein